MSSSTVSHEVTATMSLLDHSVDPSTTTPSGVPSDAEPRRVDVMGGRLEAALAWCQRRAEERQRGAGNLTPHPTAEGMRISLLESYDSRAPKFSHLENRLLRLILQSQNRDLARRYAPGKNAVLLNITASE